MPSLVPKGSKRIVALRWGIPVVGTIGICVYSYIQYGVTWRMLFLLLMFWASYVYHRFGLRFLDPINFQLLYPAGLGLWVGFLLWDPAEHLPFGSDMEYPHLAGLGFGMAMGMLVVMTRAFDVGATTLFEAVRFLRHDVVLLSIVTVTGYGLFIPYSYAMYQVFTEGHHIFALLAIFSMVAFLAFAHNKARSPGD